MINILYEKFKILKLLTPTNQIITLGNLQARAACLSISLYIWQDNLNNFEYII